MNRLLAHQGGWDELLWFSVPIVVVLLWVRWAERKARSRRTARTTPTTLPQHDADD